MIQKLKNLLAAPYVNRISNLAFILFLLGVVIFCFTRISSAVMMLSQNF